MNCFYNQVDTRAVTNIYSVILMIYCDLVQITNTTNARNVCPFTAFLEISFPSILQATNDQSG